MMAATFRWKSTKTPKYHNRKVELDGHVFDSTHERDRYVELKLLQRGRQIYDLSLQVPFELIPAQRGPDGKIIEHAVKYIADFTYRDKTGKMIVEDAKGVRTDAYIIKRKLMLERFGTRISEV